MSSAKSRVVPNDLSVGDMARRSGVAVSTLHYYEAEGLIQSWRTPANHRRYDRRMLRRVAVIRVAQGLGISLAEVRDMLKHVPMGGAVRKGDWTDASASWRSEIDARIAQLETLRDQLDHCIGCGCLSLESCPLYNPSDGLGKQGTGPRRWLAKNSAKRGDEGA